VVLAIGRMSATGASTQAGHREVRALDKCLGQLEEANERGERAVSEPLAQAFGTHVAGLRAGLAINEALDLVFGQQERLLKGATGQSIDTLTSGHRTGPTVRRAKIRILTAAPASPTPTGEGNLSLDQARDVTDRIKADIGMVGVLMLAAHEGRAWVALGYGTWEAYVRTEFGLSRSRSYELLTQGRVVREIRKAARMSGMPDISSRLAMRLSPSIGAIAETIAARLPDDMSPETVADVVNDVIKTYRRLGSTARRHLRATAAARDDRQDVCSSAPDLRRSAAARWLEGNRFSLSDVTDYLSDMPPIEDLLQLLDDDRHPSMRLSRAARRLSELASAFARTQQSRSA
jgi:hypothetical protein